MYISIERQIIITIKEEKYGTTTFYHKTSLIHAPADIFFLYIMKRNDVYRKRQRNREKKNVL
jgi:hypothetical protein